MKGQSLFEVLVAMAVAALIVVGIVILATNSIRNTTYSRNNSLANRYAQEGIEWLRGQRENNWTNFLNQAISNTIYCLDNLDWSPSGACVNRPITNTIFTRQVTFSCYSYIVASPQPTPIGCSDVTVNTVNASISVSWTDAQGTHTVESRTDFSNWKAQ